MATSLGKVGIVDRGNYSSEVTYNSGDFVFYEGSTWLALKDGLIGVNPAEGENWKYLARGVPENIQDEIDSIKNNKLDKTEFDNLTIGGRNLALGSSSKYTNVNYAPNGVNTSTILNKVLNEGLNVGDTLMIKAIIKYENIVSTDGQKAKIQLAGNGDVTAWGHGSISKSGEYVISDSGEIEIIHSIRITSDHIKNKSWDLRLIHYYISSGFIQVKNVKVENGTKPTDWTPAPEDIQDQFDNIKIGGRNLARETNQGNKNWSWSLETGSKTVESEIIDGINCVKLTKTQDVPASGWNMVYYNNFERNRIKPNTEYILSFEVKSNKALNINADLAKRNSTDYLTETSKAIKGKVEGNDTWTKVVFLLKTYSELPTSTDQVIYLRGFNFENGAIHYIRNLMLEEGTKPTDWTPAPEDVQDQINSIQNPVFDDSGTTEGINSFTDFMEKVKSKMNIFQFYRDFKAGMKYVLHTGRLVNNAVTTQEGFALDARMGKTLQDQITDVNNNINYELIRDGNPDNYTATTRKRMFNATGNVPFGIEGDNDFFLDVASSNSDEDLVWQIARNIRAKETKFRNRIGGKWTDWDKYVTNSDIGNIIFKRIESEQISNANDAPFGLSVISPLGSNNPFNFWATLITTGQELYSQQIALPWSNVDRPKYRVKDGGTWHDWTNMYG